jgi:hypothetical protein
MRRNFLVLLLVFPLFSRAGEIPPNVIPAGVGVNIHFVTGHQEDLDRIAAAGFKFIRMDFGWSAIERRKGEYDWKQYGELLEHLEQRGLRAVFILDYSNPLYEETVTSLNPLTHQSHQTTASPQHTESIDGYARWAAAAVTHFAGRHVLWEIWNEPNIDFWSPKPNAQQYTALALAACKAIRQAEPAATIIGPASSGFPWEFLEVFFKSGVLEYLDAISVHPYRSPSKPPETAGGDYERLRELVKRHAPPGRANIPILSGEWGYSSWNRGVSMETQAAFAVRQQLSNMLNGVPLSIWYDWKNDGPDSGENEHNFGTVLPDLKPKPAYIAFQTYTRELSGFHILNRIQGTNQMDYVVLLANEEGKEKIAAWSLSEPHTTLAEMDAAKLKKVHGTKGDGEAFSPRTEGQRLSLDLTALPQYITLNP